jgi:hypothetical protein
MRIATLVSALALTMALAAPAFATEQGVVGGAVVGGATGALVGGPVGAVVGAGAGAVVGGQVTRRHYYRHAYYSHPYPHHYYR